MATNDSGTVCTNDFSTSAIFSVWDYVVFGIVLAISVGIGFYHAFSGDGQKTTTEFLLANRSMSAFPVALSVFASFFSASTILGTPAEVYRQGTMYWMCVWGAMVAPLVGALLFGPFFHYMNLVSVYEYLEQRFHSKAVRLLGSLLFIIKATLGMGIVIFGPSVALSEVTGFPVWAAITSVGVVCALYTTLGGMKAVIWTDVFQTVIMVAGILAVIIQGCIATGGIVNAWEIAEEGGRIEFFDFNPDPTVRHTFWTLVVGNFFVWLPPYTADQQMMQRFSSTKSLKQAVIALLLNIPSIFIMITLCCLIGVIMYAYYATCDPLTSGRVDDPNQLLPRFVMDIFYFAPGIPGLFTASLFCAALSSVSSMINSLAACTFEDFIKPCIGPDKVSDRVATICNKVIGVFYAGVGIGMAFLFSTVGGTVLQMSIAFNGATGAPMVGLFILGAFFPWVNWIGAMAGGIVGFIFPMWISIGAYATKPDVMKDMVNSVECCYYGNDTTTAMTTLMTSVATDYCDYCTVASTDAPQSSGGGIAELYTLSYLWYTTVGILTTVFVGNVVSFLSGYTHTSEVEPKLMISYVDRFWCCLPESFRRKCRCGIQFEEVSQSEGDDVEAVDIKSYTPTTFDDIIITTTNNNNNNAINLFDTDTTKSTEQPEVTSASSRSSSPEVIKRSTSSSSTTVSDDGSTRDAQDAVTAVTVGYTEQTEF